MLIAEHAALRITVRIQGSAVFCEVAGEVDRATAAQLQGALTDTLAEAPAAVVVDLTGVTFLDSSGLRVLIETHLAGR